MNYRAVLVPVLRSKWLPPGIPHDVRLSPDTILGQGRVSYYVLRIRFGHVMYRGVLAQ